MLSGCGQGVAGDAAASPSVPGPSLDLPTPSPVPTCPPEGVVVSAGPVDGAMGLRAVTLRLANCGRTPYTVRGYPDLGVLDEDGGDVPVEVSRGFPPGDPVVDAPPTTVVIGPGRAAVAPVMWRLLVEADGTESVTGPLTVAPAKGRDRQKSGLDVDLGTTRKLTVGAWRAEGGS